MSDFSCPVVKLKIEKHPNADSIEIAKVGDYQSIVRKGMFKDGDLAIYIPEQSVVPKQILEEMNMWDSAKNKGMLAGSEGTRLKAIKLRGVLSQGLIYPLVHQDGMSEGTNVAELLGVTKYEPPIPATMVGRILGADLTVTAKYDFENIKKQTNMFEDGEEVVITEKIHGTLLQIGIVPKSLENEKFYKGRIVISSKGMGARGYILDHNDETNLYAQTVRKHGILDKVLDNFTHAVDTLNEPIFIFGEVYGKTLSGAGIQDLTYDNSELGFRIFDSCLGNRGTEKFLPWADLKRICVTLGVETVPELYVGPYSKAKLLELTDGNTTLGDGSHIREGVVVKSTQGGDDCLHPHYGRKIAKSISEAYLLRKNATEFN